MGDGRNRRVWGTIALLGAIVGSGTLLPDRTLPLQAQLLQGLTQPARSSDASAAPTSFLVVAGGGAPSYNEIALEKNVRYFQRTLAELGWDPAIATAFFANGNDGQATVRYLDLFGRERFKVPAIEHLTGAATLTAVTDWFTTYPQTPPGQDGCPAFFYFTGHGALNEGNPDNNAMILWGEDFLSVQQLAQTLDQWPAAIPFVTMMAQCYSGSFANLIYEGGDPQQPIALQTRCGFFATVPTRPSVGCTPLVNEADYEDYSSSFFAGLSGRDRVGNPAPSADYNRDGRVSFAEAHAFAKVDEETPDWPISTSEAWLQEQATTTQEQTILASPMQTWRAQARPEQQYVIESLAAKLRYDLKRSFEATTLPAGSLEGDPVVLAAYRMRLRMELLNVGMEVQLRQTGEVEAIATLDKLLDCESGTW